MHFQSNKWLAKMSSITIALDIESGVNRMIRQRSRTNTPSSAKHHEVTCESSTSLRTCPSSFEIN